jgi:hypothetical protein
MDTVALDGSKSRRTECTLLEDLATIGLASSEPRP